MRPHPTLTAWISAGVVLTCGLLPQALAQPSAVPSQERCTFLELRLDGGWWLQIHRDRPAAYGFGALPHAVAVNEGTFSIDTVYEKIIQAVVESHRGTHVTVTFSPMPGNEGRGFGVVGADTIVSELFARAYVERNQNVVNEFQRQALEVLDLFWSDAPFLH